MVRQIGVTLGDKKLERESQAFREEQLRIEGEKGDGERTPI